MWEERLIVNRTVLIYLKPLKHPHPGGGAGKISSNLNEIFIPPQDIKGRKFNIVKHTLFFLQCLC
jgi:hypothetical protein